MNVFSLASQGMNLTPGQRAFLKTVQSLLIQALSLGLTAGLSAIALYIVQLSTGVSVDYVAMLRLFGVAAGLAVVNSLGHGLSKYLSAQGDVPLAVAVDGVTRAIQQRAAPAHVDLVTNAVQPTVQTPALSAQVPLSQLDLSRSSVVSSPTAVQSSLAQQASLQYFDLSSYPVVPSTVPAASQSVADNEDTTPRPAIVK